jgi:predicted amidohydrolase YtcJ
MTEGRHPTRYELDWVSTVHPIALTHFSGHIMVANSMALSMVGLNSASDALAGGTLDAYANGTLTGVAREAAFLPLSVAFSLSFTKLTTEQIKYAANEYLKAGVTTAHDMVQTENEAKVYSNLGAALPVDVNGYYLIASADLTVYNRIVSTYNTTRYRTRGVKFIMDGSIQGYTAYLTQPYYVPSSLYSSDLTGYTYDSSRSCSNAGENCGINILADNNGVAAFMNLFLKNNNDIHVHCNGDAAGDNMISAMKKAKAAGTTGYVDARVTMIHAQTVREDQLD